MERCRRSCKVGAEVQWPYGSVHIYDYQHEAVMAYDKPSYEPGRFLGIFLGKSVDDIVRSAVRVAECMHRDSLVNWTCGEHACNPEVVVHNVLRLRRFADQKNIFVPKFALQTCRLTKAALLRNRPFVSALLFPLFDRFRFPPPFWRQFLRVGGREHGLPTPSATP